MLNENNSNAISAEQPLQPIDDQDIWRIVANAGIKIRPHYLDPSQGWTASVHGGRLGPFPTPEEALSAAIRSLVERLQQAESQIEHAASQRRGWHWVRALFGWF